jgi:alanine racemase
MATSGTLTVDLAAICDNWRLLAQQCGSRTITAAVVKANAYGLGVDAIGVALKEAGCRHFFFATLAEARAFKVADDNEIYRIVLGGLEHECEHLYIKEKIIPVLSSLEAVARWVEASVNVEAQPPCVIKINTGMTRLGMEPLELEQLCGDAQLFGNLNPMLLLSHLACADESGHPLNKKQLEIFKRSVVLVKQRFPDIACSLANSSGIFLGRAWHFDLLRPGAAIYGINPTPLRESPVKNVIQLRLPILQIRTLIQDESIGYAATIRLQAGTRLAVVAGGYADGLHRVLGAVPEGELAGYPVRGVGRISMDTMIFDITQVPESTEALLGSSIEVIGSRLTIDYLMKKNGGLGYEVLTGLGARFTRNYVGGKKFEH